MTLHYPEFTPALRATHEAAKARRARLFSPRAVPTVVPEKPCELPSTETAVATQATEHQCPAEQIALPPIKLTLYAKGQVINRVIAKEFGLSVDELRSTSRKFHISRPRQIGMYLAKDMLKKSWGSTVRIFGRKDHTTAIHACKVVGRRIAKDSDYAAKVEALRDKIEQCFAEPTA